MNVIGRMARSDILKEWAVIHEESRQVFENRHLIIGGNKAGEPVHGLFGRQAPDLDDFFSTRPAIFFRDRSDVEAVLEWIEPDRIVSIGLFDLLESWRRCNR